MKQHHSSHTLTTKAPQASRFPEGKRTGCGRQTRGCIIECWKSPEHWREHGHKVRDHVMKNAPIQTLWYLGSIILQPGALGSNSAASPWKLTSFPFWHTSLPSLGGWLPWTIRGKTFVWRVAFFPWCSRLYRARPLLQERPNNLKGYFLSGIFRRAAL